MFFCTLNKCYYKNIFLRKKNHKSPKLVFKKVIKDIDKIGWLRTVPDLVDHQDSHHQINSIFKAFSSLRMKRIEAVPKARGGYTKHWKVNNIIFRVDIKIINTPVKNAGFYDVQKISQEKSHLFTPLMWL